MELGRAIGLPQASRRLRGNCAGALASMREFGALKHKLNRGREQRSLFAYQLELMTRLRSGVWR